MNLIKLINITKSYGRKKVLGPINLEIQKGSTVAIFGANGSGKTTLCEIISNTKNVSTGQVIYSFNKKQIPYLMGVNFQDQVYPNFVTVKEMVVFYEKIYGKFVSANQQQAMVKKFHLEELFSHSISKLSGGQRQRVNLFLSLFHNPEIYIGDELSTGLDIQMRSQILEYLQQEIKQHHITLILVSHNLDEIEALCERIIFLQDGKIINDEKVHEVIKKYGSLLNYYLAYQTKSAKKESTL